MRPSKPVPFKVRHWLRSVTTAGCSVRNVSTLQEIDKKDGTHLFSLLHVNVADPQGRRLPHIVFIRGHAVVIVPMLINTQTNEKRFLMVEQRRIGNGSVSLEFPAGMIDRENDQPQDVALKELSEESGLIITPDKLIPLCDRPLFSSAGGMDESIYFFGCRIELSPTDFLSFNERICGNPDENEHITVTLLTKEEALPRITSLQALLGLFLFEEMYQHERE